MTCQKSLINTAKNMFNYKFKGTIIISVIQFLLLCLIFPYGLISSINMIDNNISIQNSKEKITDVYKYIISNDMPSYCYLVIFIIIVAGIALGIKQFKFFADKKTVNVFYSLGITRTKMFLSTYVSGVLAQVLSVGIPVTISYFISIGTFGLSKELTNSYLLILFSLIVVSLLVFTLTAVVFSLVGSLVEGIFYACFTIGFPTGILFCFGLMAEKMLFGSTIFGTVGSYYSPIDVVMSNVIEGKFSIISPVLFPVRNIIHYSKLTLDTNFDVQGMSKWSDPHYGSLIVWAALCAVFAFIGLAIFNRRKAEICGFVGTNKFLNFILFSTIGIISVAFITLFELKRSLTILIGLIVAIITTSIIILVLSKISKIKLTKEFIKIPLYLCAAIATVIVLSTGMFGYSSKVPKTADIKSISVNSITGDVFNSNDGYFSYSPTEEFAGTMFTSISSNTSISVTDVNDIDTIMQIHKDIIDIGNFEPKESADNIEKTIFSTGINIKYTLKNGKTFERKYNAANKNLLEEMLKINDTNAYKTRFIESINNANNAVKIFSNDLLTANDIDLSKTELMKLKECIAIDYQKLSAIEIAHPSVKSVGVIQFYDNSSEYKDPNDTIIFSTTYYGSTSIFLTEKMTNTLNYLKELGYDKYLDIDESLDVVSATLISASNKDISKIYCSIYNAMSLDFKGSSYMKMQDYEKYPVDTSTNINNSNVVIKDKSMIQYLRNNAYSNYFVSEDGYFVIFETKDESKSGMFIPADKLPQSIISSINKK